MLAVQESVPYCIPYDAASNPAPPACTGYPGRDLFLINLERVECPNALATFGIALSYATMLQVVMFLLYSMCIPKDKKIALADKQFDGVVVGPETPVKPASPGPKGAVAV